MDLGLSCTYFQHFNRLSGGKVVMENNIAYKMEGIGGVILKFENGFLYTL